MLPPRARTHLIVAGRVIVVALLVAVIALNNSYDGVPVTKQRLADEVFGDLDVASCTYDAMGREHIDRSIFNHLLNTGLPDVDERAESADSVVVPQEQIDRVSAIVLACSPVAIESLDLASGGGLTDQSGQDAPSAGAPPAEGSLNGDEPSQQPKPMLRIAADGSAEVIWVPSTDIVRVDPDIPESASNR